MTGCVLTSDTHTVNIDTIKNINFNTTRVVNTYVFSDDTDAVLDEGKQIDQIVLNGVQYNNHHDSMVSLNGMMDLQEDVVVSGLDDYYLNTDYLMYSISFNQTASQDAAGIYNFSITLERIEDRLPYSEL